MGPDRVQAFCLASSACWEGRPKGYGSVTASAASEAAEVGWGSVLAPEPAAGTPVFLRLGNIPALTASCSILLL